MGRPFTSAPRDRHLTGLERRNAIAADKCPECSRGELDTGWECLACGFDARDETLAIPEMSHTGRSDNDQLN